MYFLWKNTPYGIIRISGDGLYEFADDVLRSKLRLYSVTLSPSEDAADISIVISDEQLLSPAKKNIENHFSSVMNSMGLNASVIWATPERSIASVMSNPYVWAVISSCVAVVFSAGMAGFFWAAFWGAAGWFTVRGLVLLSKRFRSS